MSDVIRAPFTNSQVTALNMVQQSGAIHPFTCGKRSASWHGEGVLIATKKGWVCPEDRCDYTQDWAYRDLANVELVTEMVKTHREFLDGLFGRSTRGESSDGA